MQPDRLSAVRPFEICSIRPPTENNSLTFRLTRNCYWNKCAFCPIYKTGAKFKKRSMEEVREDVTNARILDDLLAENGISGSMDTRSIQQRAVSLIQRIRQARQEAGVTDKARCMPLENSPDPRMRWFSSWFIDYPDISDCVEHLVSWRISGSRSCFLGDADALILRPDHIGAVMAHIHDNFPEIARFTVYGRTRTAAGIRSEKDLAAFADAGIDRVHFGVESGSADVLKMVNKGATPDDHINGVLKAARAGLSCSFYIMPGLGGVAMSQQHAVETARVINEAKADYVRIRTLEIFDGTPIDVMRKKGTFVEADDDTVVLEIKRLIQEIRVETELLSDSATNLLQVNGRLPEDRERMLAVIDEYLSMEPRQRIEYSLRSRLAAFAGQYGGLSDEVLSAIAPVLKDGSLDLGQVPDGDLKQMTAFVKSRLMP
ncbi:MAG: radical SAM protein [Desulfobacterales bacterium]|nr:radical SAM protein [Desulfobacterales bacterium]